MKTVAAIFVLLILNSSCLAQNYLRGEVKDEKNTPLANAKIILHSTGYVYYSGSSGSFGIMTKAPTDSITISLNGYQILSRKVEVEKFQSIILKLLFASGTAQKNRLNSVTANLKPQDRKNFNTRGETYSSLVENEFIGARKYPETGFAINTDKASYSNVRRFLNMNTTVPPDAVRTEELMNYFNFGYTAPGGDSVFRFQSYVSECPWNADNELLYLNVCARKIDPSRIPPSNLVFLIDISGSMDMPNRLPLLKSGFKLLVDNLRESDTVSIVVYGSTTGIMLQPTSGKEKEKIRKAIEDLYPGGSTPGESGILAAYRLAKNKFIVGGNNRVILATDGDFNVGQNSEDELEKMITQHQQSGIYLTCLGVGMGNYKDSKLEALSKKGNGNFAYIDNEKEAEKVLVTELTQTLYTVADDAFLNIKFNPEFVREYRLIGFDNKSKALADSLSEVEGGEIGSGHSLMALFEISPVTPSMTGLDKYMNRGSLAQVNLTYRTPDDTVRLKSASYSTPYTLTSFNDLPSCYRFASSVAMFAAMLKDSRYYRHISWADALVLANNSRNPKDAIQNEFVLMIEKARKIYAKVRKKRRDE